MPPVRVIAYTHGQANTYPVQSPLKLGIRMAMNAWQCNLIPNVNIIVHPNHTSVGWVRSKAPLKRLKDNL